MGMRVHPGCRVSLHLCWVSPWVRMGSEMPLGSLSPWALSARTRKRYTVSGTRPCTVCVSPSTLAATVCHGPPMASLPGHRGDPWQGGTTSPCHPEPGEEVRGVPESFHNVGDCSATALLIPFPG